MAEWRSEAIIRFLAVLRSRRGALAEGLLGLLLLMGLAGPDAAEAGKGKARRRHRKRKQRRRRRRRNRKKNRCQGGLTRCDGVCVDTQSDPLNCGGCGDECDGDEQCINGVCGCDVCKDDKACPFQTVQDAVNAASAGDTITICRGSYDGNVVIDKNLTLIGAGEQDTKLEGEDGGSVVTVEDGVTAAIFGVTISGGTGTERVGFLEGGGVFNRGTLTLTDCVVSNNQAERGGGILNFTERDLTLDNTVVMDNKIVTSQPGPTYGGGILNLFSAQLTMINGSAVVRNRARNSGGIHNNGKLNMTNGLVEDNVADFDGAGIINDEGIATLNNSVVRSNTATAGRGGGILNLGFALTIENGSEIRENQAGTFGGGIYNEPVGVVVITDSFVVENEANESGGGILNLRGRVTLVRTEVSGNDAGDIGGGAVNAGPAAPHEPATLALEASTIRDNWAREDGGGIINTGNGIVTLDDDSSVTDNSPNNCVGTDACEA